MCRWLAYAGDPLLPSILVLDSPHSIVAQSRNSPLGAETVNGDGFGFGWYPRDDRTSGKPSLFHSTEPAWNDENLRELTTAIESPLFFAHVRAATHPPVQQSNCHPFRYENWMFMHNGAISGWPILKRDLTLAVDPALYPLISGTTDSEVMFYLALTLGLQQDPLNGLREAVRLVEATGRSHGVRFPMQGTMAVSDGHTLWTVRYSTQGRSRTLFHSADIPTLRQLYPDAEQLHLFSDHDRVIVSEPLNDLPGAFLEVPESTATIIDVDGFRYEPFAVAA
ncbi:class II glutamine amidotransferase [Rathayibacter sp. YIM 133350]|uniref:class II glutamine amidotransferase n=1 Tax=Rathayibacter sp. YIM 133350 TaxID=3131992 RepID=UPI00307EE74F